MPRKKKPKDDLAVHLSGGVSKPVADAKTPVARKAHRLGASNVDGIEVRKEILPLWEDKFDTDALLEKYRAMGAREFDRGFRQLAISDEDLLWKDDAIQKALEDDVCLPTELSGTWLKLKRFAGVDIAVADEEKAGSFFVIMVIGIDSRNHRWIIAIERHRGWSFHQQSALILEMHKRWQPEHWMIESVNAQKFLVQDTELHGIPVTGLHTSAVHKSDLEIGIPSMAAEWEQGMWHVPYGDDRSRRIVAPFLDELHAYPMPGHSTDTIMASFFCREAYRQIRQPEASLYVVGL